MAMAVNVADPQTSSRTRPHFTGAGLLTAAEAAASAARRSSTSARQSSRRAQWQAKPLCASSGRASRSSAASED
eukprot:9395615-Alexandrium_andersonii.AAC.1